LRGHLNVTTWANHYDLPIKWSHYFRSCSGFYFGEISPLGGTKKRGLWVLQRIFGAKFLHFKAKKKG
jgi:hypothetical protein